MKALARVSRPVRVSKLQTHQQIYFFEEWIEADGRLRPLEKSAAAGFVGKTLQTTLAIKR